jgi:hypothetical protein
MVIKVVNIKLSTPITPSYRTPKFQLITSRENLQTIGGIEGLIKHSNDNPELWYIIAFSGVDYSVENFPDFNILKTVHNRILMPFYHPSESGKMEYVKHTIDMITNQYIEGKL